MEEDMNNLLAPESEEDVNNLLADSRRRDYLEYGLPLYRATMKGDWGAARQIRDQHPGCFSQRITKQGDTALHIAAISSRTDFVRQLVSIPGVDLALKNNIGNTALCLAAASGTVAMARAMVDANHELPMIRGNEDLSPLHMAALLGQEDMVNYLLERTFGLSWEELVSLFISTINTDLYEIALKIITKYPDLALTRDDQTRETPLHVLAKKPQMSCQIPRGFLSINFYKCRSERIKHEDLQLRKLELIEQLWGIVVRQTQDDISQLMADPWRIMFVAVEVGNVEFVTKLISLYPDLIWKLDERHRSIFHVAVQFRQEKIFRLIYEIGAIKDLLAAYSDVNTQDNMLHLAAMLPSSHILNCISGAALQMQREMSWFKVVEDIIQPRLAVATNNNGETPRVLFTEQHKELRKEGEEWMRKTAASCSVVATLIAGVAFGAALKAPGSGSTGSWHLIFAFFVSLSLIFSTASILMFLSILTSRYAEEDFLKSLPQKLVIGLSLLFISIASMMIAFTVTFLIIFKHLLLVISTAVLACIPIVLFALQEFPLLLEVRRSTIGCN